MIDIDKFATPLVFFLGFIGIIGLTLAAFSAATDGYPKQACKDGYIHSEYKDWYVKRNPPIACENKE